ncbi:C2 domain-containing protein [Myxococcota bacterium]|nr:C2 domain-containing protein [Myxococcota bacterium]
MIGPGTASGEGWEGGAISQEAAKKITEIMTKAATSYFGLPSDFGLGAALGEISSLLVGLSAPPDVFGTAELLSPAQTPLQIELPQKDDTYNPTWGVGWSNVPLSREAKIRIVLTDYDPLDSNDDIGTAMLNFNHLIAAYWKGEVVQINVAGQTNNSILFVGISVVR